MALTTDIDDLFRMLFSEPHKWKITVSNLCALSKKPQSPFSDDAAVGFMYCEAAVYNIICEGCNDEKPLAWLNTYGRAWLGKTELPRFPRQCLNGHCEDVY